jgi:hypothetical protein
MYPLDIPGLTGDETSVGDKVLEFVFNGDANEQTIMRLVSELPPDIVFMFYDADYPSPSDPGAFVSVRRDNDQYRIERSNHGWQKKSEPISAEKLVGYLSKCTKHNMGPDSMRRMRWYTVPPSPPTPPKKWWQFWK